MTSDDIFNLATKAGISELMWWDHGDVLQRFAALVAAPLEEEIKRLRFCIPEGDAAAAMEYLAYCVEKAVAAEREACAKLADKCIEDSQGVTSETEQEANYLQAMRILSEEFAIAIRARGN